MKTGVLASALEPGVRLTEPTAVSHLSPTALGEEAQEELIEADELQLPSLVTAEPEYSEPVLLEREQEQIASSEMPWQTQGELFPAQEQEEQLREQVEEPQENGQKIKAEPQAELPEAQSDIMDMKRKSKEDLRSIQEENLQQQRGDQQNQVSEKVAGTPPMKYPLSFFLEKIKAQLNAELQTAQIRMKARLKRLEDEMKIIRKKLNPLPQALQKQVQVLTSDWTACEDFQQMSATEGPQVRSEAQEQCPPEVLQVGHELKMVQEKRMQWDEAELLNEELQVCLQLLEGEGNP
ncbi:rho GTPase-activating protein gacV-like [Melospiza melodia melodia]|uniref:rho GTPase-activating protein gacV-like n=1 Tax=Melospiza melodia melodia TaxID=1914991 RepID=UPI002FCEDC60